jgi:hypothetical protein
VPTVAEAALPGFDFSLWGGYFAPRETPDAIVARLNTEITKVLADPDLRARFEAEGSAVEPDAARRVSTLSCAPKPRSTPAGQDDQRRRSSEPRILDPHEHRCIARRRHRPEIMAVTVDVLQAASKRFALGLQLDHDIAGHDSLRRHGATVTPALLEKVKAADGLMLGPMATYDFKDEAKGEINPSKFFRKELDLYANIRPGAHLPGLPNKVGRSTWWWCARTPKGFYADRNIESGGSEMLITRDVVVSLRRITRQCCERIARSAFELAMTRRQARDHRAQGQRAEDRRRHVHRDVPRRGPRVSRGARSTTSSSTR